MATTSSQGESATKPSAADASLKALREVFKIIPELIEMVEEEDTGPLESFRLQSQFHTHAEAVTRALRELHRQRHPDSVDERPGIG